jgi:tetratricopeptide (TPR) repeat protein
MTKRNQRYRISNLEYWIKQLGYKKYEVAEGTNIPLRTLNDYCKGRTTIPRYRLETLAAFLECPISVLLNKTEPAHNQLVPFVSQDREGQDMDEVRRQFIQQTLSVTSAGLAALLPTLEQFSRALTRPLVFDETTVRYLEARTVALWRDRHSAIVASSVLLNYVLEHLQKILVFLEWPLLPSERRRLCSLASGTAQLAGHLLFDLGEYSSAREYHKGAIKSAREASNAALEAMAWGRMSFTWTYSDNAQKALPCIQQARSIATGKASQTVQAYLSTVEAEIQAVLDNQQASLKALDEAEHLIKQPQHEEDNYWLRFDHSRLEGYQGACFRRFYNPENPKTVSFLLQAQEALRDALALLTPSMIQRRPALLIDIASTYVQQKEVEAACEHITQAIIILAQTRSKTVMQRLLTLRQDLDPWHDTSYVKTIDNHIEALVSGWRRSL